MAAEHDPRAVGQERRGLGGDAGGAEPARLAGAGGEEHHLVRVPGLPGRQHPAAVGRQRQAAAVAQPHRRRAIGAAEEDRVVAALRGEVLLLEEDDAAVAETAVGNDQSSQERVRARGSPAACTTISRCMVVRLRSTCPCGATSWRKMPPIERNTRRLLPLTVASRRAWPVGNSTVSPAADHARPLDAFEADLADDPAVSTTFTEAWLSPRLAWSRNATRRPSRLTRAWEIQPPVS